MAYDVILAQINSPLGGFGTVSTAMGFPAKGNFPWNDTFNNLFYSQWVCGASNRFGRVSIGPSFVPFFGFGVGGVNTTGSVSLSGTPAGNPGNAFIGIIFAASFDSSMVTGVRSHMMLSVDCPSQTVQVYINDQPCPLTITTPWVADGAFNLGYYPATFWDWDVENTLTTGLHPGVGDIWCAGSPQIGFVDLSITANRRKFINADLTPVNLGPNGTAPFGVQPQIYCTVQQGGAPTDIFINRGMGGKNFTSSYAPTFQTPGTCSLPIPPAPPAWYITSSLSLPQGGATGDVWANNSYIDFNDQTTRNEFQNPDASWLWLGTNGEKPTGASPQLFLTVQPSDAPSDILTGYGQDGAQSAWTLDVQGVDPTTGQPYAPMSFDVCEQPAASNLVLTDIEVLTATPTIPDDQITLRWSDDAGASWCNGRLQSLGKVGEYFTTPTWYRLGMSRNRVYELSWSGARAEALQGAYVFVSIAAT